MSILQRSNSPSPNPPGQLPPGTQARGAARSRAGVDHLTFGPPRPKFTLVVPRSSWALLRRAQPSRPGPDPDSTPRASRSDRRRGAASPGAWSNSPVAGFSRARPSCPLGLPTVAWAARRPLRTVITSGETLNSSRGRARLSSTPPGTHAPPEPRAGNTPAPGAKSSRDKKKKKKNVPARHGTATSAPHALRRRPHALPPRPRHSAPGTHRQLKPPRKGRRGSGRAGPDTIWQSTAAAPAAPSSRLRDTQPRAGSGSCGGGRRSTTSHPPSPLPLFLPPPPRCHGNAAPRRLAPPLLPSRLPRPAQAPLPLASWAAAAPSGLPSRRVGGGRWRPEGRGGLGRPGGDAGGRSGAERAGK